MQVDVGPQDGDQQEIRKHEEQSSFGWLMDLRLAFGFLSRHALPSFLSFLAESDLGKPARGGSGCVGSARGSLPAEESRRYRG